MEVRWLVTGETVGSEKTVVGRTMLRPGSNRQSVRQTTESDRGEAQSTTGEIP